MKRTLVTVLLGLAASVVGAEPNLIIINGRVWTGDSSKPWAEGVAITGEKIAQVGSTAEIAALKGETTKVIDAGGKLVIPGINDAHVHPSSGMATFELPLDLNAKWDDVAAAIASTLEETPADLWITGTLGPAMANDPSITRQKLDQLAPKRKIMLTSFTGHGKVLSSAAMDALRVGERTPDPTEGGWYGRDANNELTGRVFEYVQFALDRRFADMASNEALDAAVTNLSNEAIRYGITSIQAMPITSEPEFEKAVRRTGIPLRVRLISFPLNLAHDPWVQKNGALKYILDGTPIERGAALRTATYDGGGKGRENFRDLTPMVNRAAESGQQLLLHASGDKTVASALEAFAKKPLNRPRLEHADGLLPDLFPLAKKTGAIAVVNPSHFPFRSFYPKTAPYMPALSLLKNGIPLAIGSDGPLNPYLNIMFATARDDMPTEALSREEALRAYTSGSAYAEMTETSKGKIAPGYLADIAVLSQDIFKVPVDALPGTHSVVTIIGGKVVHE